MDDRLSSVSPHRCLRRRLQTKRTHGRMDGGCSSCDSSAGSTRGEGRKRARKAASSEKGAPAAAPAPSSSIECLGADCLLHIFAQLPLVDLCRVGCVCKQWNSLATHSSLWKRVLLEPSLVRITNWGAFVEKVNAGVVELEIRLVPDYVEIDEFWRDAASFLALCGRLQRLAISHAPSSVVEHLAASLVELRALVVDSIEFEMYESEHEDGGQALEAAPATITEPEGSPVEGDNSYGMSDASTPPPAEAAALSVATPSRSAPLLQIPVFDLSKFALSVQLTELCLIGNGVFSTLPFSFSGGLKALENLTSLETLAIAPISANDSDDFSFFERLVRLKTLAIGECTHWDDSIYARLGSLVSLQSLSLERGGSLTNVSLYESLACLTNLRKLQLHMFTFSPAFQLVLHKLTQLDVLSAQPAGRTYAEFTESTVHCLNACVAAARHRAFVLHWGVLSRETFDEPLLTSDAPLGEDSVFPLFPEERHQYEQYGLSPLLGADGQGDGQGGSSALYTTSDIFPPGSTAPPTPPPLKAKGPSRSTPPPQTHPCAPALDDARLREILAAFLDQVDLYEIF